MSKWREDRHESDRNNGKEKIVGRSDSDSDEDQKEDRKFSEEKHKSKRKEEIDESGRNDENGVAYRARRV